MVDPSPAAVQHLQAEQPDHEFRRHHQKPLPALGLEGKLQDVKISLSLIPAKGQLVPLSSEFPRLLLSIFLNLHFSPKNL